MKKLGDFSLKLVEIEDDSVWSIFTTITLRPERSIKVTSLRIGNFVLSEGTKRVEYIGLPLLKEKADKLFFSKSELFFLLKTPEHFTEPVNLFLFQCNCRCNGVL